MAKESKFSKYLSEATKDGIQDFIASWKGLFTDEEWAVNCEKVHRYLLRTMIDRGLWSSDQVDLVFGCMKEEENNFQTAWASIINDPMIFPPGEGCRHALSLKSNGLENFFHVWLKTEDDWIIDLTGPLWDAISHKSHLPARESVRYLPTTSVKSKYVESLSGKNVEHLFWGHNDLTNNYCYQLYWQSISIDGSSTDHDMLILNADLSQVHPDSWDDYQGASEMTFKKKVQLSTKLDIKNSKWIQSRVQGTKLSIIIQTSYMDSRI